MTAIQSLVVTGAAGFLGQAVVKAALARGVSVHAVIRPGSGASARLRAAGVAVHELDLVTTGAAARLGGLEADAWMHLAAVVPHRLRAQPVATAAAASVAMTLPVLDAASAAGVRVVLAGSSSEYGRVSGVVSEDEPCMPNTAYGAAKLAVTQLALGMTRAGLLDAIVLRPFLLYGPGQGSDMFLSALVRTLAAGQRFPMTPGEQLRDFIYVDDAAAAFLTACTVRAGADRVVNVATGTGTRLRDVALRVADTLQARHLLGFGEIPYRSTESPEFMGSAARARSMLGWRPEVTLEEGLRRTIVAVRTEQEQDA